MAEPFDLVVIGSGPAGEKAAVHAAFFGKRVALVERNELTGGVAVTHVGMIPTKTLREAALYITGFRKRELYGLSVELDRQQMFTKLRQRTNDVIDTMAGSVRQNIERHGVELVHGTARLEEGGEVSVSAGGAQRRLHGEVIIVATGSRPYHPPGIPFEDPDVLDAEGVLEIEEAPRSVVVIGGGAIGCEHASIFAALGCEVHLIDRGERLLSYVDAELSQLLARIFGDEGMQVLLGADLKAVERDDQGLRVRLGDGSEVRPDKVLVSSGRVGNTDGLGLEAAGVVMDERGRIVVDEHFRTSVPGVYAAGDVIGPPALASTAMEQGRSAAGHAFGVGFQDTIDVSPPTGVYSIPEIAAVGMTEQEAASRGIGYLVGRGRFDGNARANIAGVTDGLVKLIFDSSDRTLLGVHILGEAATEVIHVGQSALNHHDPIDYFMEKTFNVPTLCEAYKYAAYDGMQRWREVVSRSPA
ncbi:MAG TPA: Si-specific NAD(P)(+) transhydrogenase [Acidimicrobiales bacterium]|nr:Si-specific NAD(P)(+) transhydrogenase [Acidimicrobiales bacterium]